MNTSVKQATAVIRVSLIITLYGYLRSDYPLFPSRNLLAVLVIAISSKKRRKEIALHLSCFLTCDGNLVWSAIEAFVSFDDVFYYGLLEVA